MEYRYISADGHIDLSWMPQDLFVSNATRSMKERMPYVVQKPDGPHWITNSGLDLGYANGKGGTGVASSGGRSMYVPGKSHRTDRMASTGLYQDSVAGIFRPSTPELRLHDQDRDGIQAEVLYGLLGAGIKMTEPEVAEEFYRIYNDWLTNFCDYDRKRFVGLAAIPCHSAEAAAAETRRVAKSGGLGGLDFATKYDMIPLWDSYWDPFWKAAADANLAVHFHTIGPPLSPLLPQDAPEKSKLASMATFAAGFQLYVATILAAIIHSGALERYPSLRIVFGESGIGWIPYVLERMDYEYQDRFSGLGLKMKPSDYWRRQCRATFQDDSVGVMLLEVMGVENVMWGSDYPHQDGVFPDSQEYIKRQFGNLPQATHRKITCENAGKFYGLIPS